MVKHMLLSISLAGRSGPILFRSFVTNIPILPGCNGSELREKEDIEASGRPAAAPQDIVFILAIQPL
jgi:hypothetical protein